MSVETCAWSSTVADRVCRQPRDSTLRERYLDAALPAIPRILAAVDRNPFGPSYGCCDREYWHYRTAAFPSEMYQEAALSLALVYRHALPRGDWQGDARLAEAAAAILRFSARSAHADGSGDDYYPQERALGATVFSLQAAVEAYRLLELDDRELREFLLRRARWVADHDESGRLTNHHALAALALWRTGQLFDIPRLREAARARVRRVVAWQSSEGWWPEYEGADPGYQTVTIDCLAKLQREAEFEGLEASLRLGVEFCRPFQHLDGGYGGEYGSRGTRHFYPHGMELLAEKFPSAAELADGYLRAMPTDASARWDDDRMYVHRVANLLEAYLDFAPRRAVCEVADESESNDDCRFPAAGIYAIRAGREQLITSTARGGNFYYCRRGTEGCESVNDSGLVVEFNDGRLAVSQTHGEFRDVQVVHDPADGRLTNLVVSGSLHFVRFERATPAKQAVLHFLAGSLGAAGRTILRKLLQRRVIAARRPAPIRLTRTFIRGATWKVHDVVELTHPRVRVSRLAFSSDLQAAYTAAANVFHGGLRQPWRDLGEYVELLNRERRIEITRDLATSALRAAAPASEA